MSHKESVTMYSYNVTYCTSRSSDLHSRSSRLPLKSFPVICTEFPLFFTNFERITGVSICKYFLVTQVDVLGLAFKAYLVVGL